MNIVPMITPTFDPLVKGFVIAAIRSVNDDYIGSNIRNRLPPATGLKSCFLRFGKYRLPRSFNSNAEKSKKNQNEKE